MPAPNLKDIDAFSTPMSEEQFECALALRGLNPESGGVVAAKLVLVDGMTNSGAAKLAGVSPSTSHRAATKLYETAGLAENYVSARMRFSESEEGKVSIVRHNLMTREGYSPYCGNMDGCPHTPRTYFTGSQFKCVSCGWESGFDSEFIKEYKSKWKLKDPAHKEELKSKTAKKNDINRDIRMLKARALELKGGA